MHYRKYNCSQHLHSEDIFEWSTLFFFLLCHSSKAAGTVKPFLYSLTATSKNSRLAICNDEYSQKTSLVQLDYYEFNCHLVPICPKMLARLFRRPPTHMAPEFPRNVCISMAPEPTLYNPILTASFARYLPPLMKDRSCFNF